jgi:ACS family 4-hydroxyphenylacetate permease-like MFS transporter
MFATGAASLYSIRAVVGLAEGGFLPGVLLYLTLWFPQAHRAKANALFMIAQPLTIAFGAPLSGLILDRHSALAMVAWRWLFVVEGLPSAILGIAAYFYLTDKPKDAKWLTEEEKDALSQSIGPPPERGGKTPWREMLSRSVVLLSIAYFGLVMTLNTIVTWTPQIVKEMRAALRSTKGAGMAHCRADALSRGGMDLRRVVLPARPSHVGPDLLLRGWIHGDERAVGRASLVTLAGGAPGGDRVC